MNATSAVDINTWSLKVEWVTSSGTTTSDDSSILSSSRCTPRPVTSLVVPAPANTAIVLARGNLVELVETHDADGSQQGIVVGRVQKAGEDGARILAHIARFRIGGDVNDDSGQV